MTAENRILGDVHDGIEHTVAVVSRVVHEEHKSNKLFPLALLPLTGRRLHAWCISGWYYFHGLNLVRSVARFVSKISFGLVSCVLPWYLSPLSMRSPREILRRNQYKDIVKNSPS